MPIRIKCSDHQYTPPNVAYIHQDRNGYWNCTLPNGISASFSYAGIDRDDTALRFALEDASTEDEVLAAILQHARRFVGGPRAGQTVFTYEIISRSAVHENVDACKSDNSAALQAMTREITLLREQLNEITGETPAQAEKLGRAENTVTRIEVIVAGLSGQRNLSARSAAVG